MDGRFLDGFDPFGQTFPPHAIRPACVGATEGFLAAAGEAVLAALVSGPLLMFRQGEKRITSASLIIPALTRSFMPVFASL